MRINPIGMQNFTSVKISSDPYTIRAIQKIIKTPQEGADAESKVIEVLTSAITEADRLSGNKAYILKASGSGYTKTTLSLNTYNRRLQGKKGYVTQRIQIYNPDTKEEMPSDLKIKDIKSLKEKMLKFFKTQQCNLADSFYSSHAE